MSQGGTAVAVAAALGDDTANPTVSSQGALALGFDGTTWDRLRSGADNSDAVTALALGLLKTASSQLGFNGTTWDRIRSGADNADGVTALATGSQKISSSGLQFNGSTWDRVRGTSDLTVFASAARTATTNGSDTVNYNGSFLHVVIDVTAAADTPSVVFTIQGKDVVSGKYYTLLASAAITGTGTTVLRVGPGLTAAANLVASDILPRTWRVIATHADSDSITYSVGASVV